MIIFKNINDLKKGEFEYINNKNNKNRGTLIQAHISDLHFGVIDPQTQYNILKTQFIDKISTLNKLDIVSINGDLFDHKFMSNSDVVMYATMFINEIVNICRRKNTTLVIIHGTLLHDAQQLKLFYHYLQDTSIDIRIIETVKFEYIKGAKILCIPELYGMGEDFYSKFLFDSGYYDSVFMHGVIKGAIYQAKNQESGIHTDKAPTFTIQDFCNCRGMIISGHVHTPGCFDSYFYYCGSPIRWQFGEEQEKGFLIVLQNLDTNKHYVHLEPIKSFLYKTINLSDILSQDPKHIIDYVMKVKNNENIDYIRIEFKGAFTDVEVANLSIIKKYFQHNKNVKLKINNNLREKTIMSVDNNMMQQMSEYDYILDKSLTEQEILTKYINQQEGYEYITVDELINILKDDE